MRLSLAEIRRRHVVEARPLDAETAAALNADPRSGAKAILAAIDRRHFANRSEGQRLRKLLRYECALWQTGIMHVAGVDEAGMSSLAGPVAAAAVIFAPGSRIPGVNDSKQLGCLCARPARGRNQGRSPGLVGRLCRGRRNRHPQHLLGGHSGYAQSGRRTTTSARARIDRRTAHQGFTDRAAAHREGRLQEPARLHPRPSSPRPRAMA